MSRTPAAEAARSFGRDSLTNASRVLRTTRRMLRDQWRPAEATREWQLGHLRRLIAHARRCVPYYRTLLAEAGVGPEDIRDPADLERIPVTTKETLRTLPLDALVSSDTRLETCVVKHTSGSTGVPFTIYWDQAAMMDYYAACIRSHRMLGAGARDRILAIGPSYYPERMAVQRLGLWRVEKMSPFAGAEAHLRRLNDARPDVLICYPSVLRLLLVAAERSGVRPHRPRTLVTSAELLDQATRELARRVLERPVHQFYGSWEMGRMANTCPEGHLHWIEDSVYAELLPAERPPSPGARRLVVTNLRNRAMPFIRYELGDYVVPLEGPCPCGRPSRRIGIVAAREADVVRLPDGRSVSALDLTDFLFLTPGVAQFQIAQITPDRLAVRVVPGPGYDDADTRRAVASIAQRVPGLATDLRLVDRIERNAGGKLRQFRPLAAAGHAANGGL
jgi:phenylacetate-CoA ligase